jgi:NADP-dependent 3-hydroxy acid dehydrogenase YdfG
MGKTAFITGATAGIGKATACRLAEAGYHIILNGRRNERLQKLGNELARQHKINHLCLSFDVRDRQKVKDIISGLPEEWKKIDLLVNNAGLAAGLDPLDKGHIEDWEKMIDTNIKGLLYVTKAVAPLMIKRRKGHIINIGSIAGKEVYASGNVYCATKHAVDALTKGMRIDFLKYNIRVTSICPGNTDTEFSPVRFKGNLEQAKKVYQGYTPLYAEDIADCVIFAVTRPDHVTINDMLVMATAQANTTHLLRNNE